MNTSFLLLGSALLLGADAPIVVGGTGCGGCGSPMVTFAAVAPSVCSPMPSCDPCGPRVGLLARLRARLASWKPACAPACAPAPVCAPVCPAPCGTPLISRPLFTGFTTSCADPCHRVGLLDRLRAKFNWHGCHDACAAPRPCAAVPCGVAGIGGCAPSLGTVEAAPAGTPPATMPAPTTPAPMKDVPKPMDTKPAEPKKDEPKKELSVSAPLNLDTARTPVLGGTSGKY